MFDGRRNLFNDGRSFEDWCSRVWVIERKPEPWIYDAIQEIPRNELLQMVKEYFERGNGDLRYILDDLLNETALSKNFLTYKEKEEGKTKEISEERQLPSS